MAPLPRMQTIRAILILSLCLAAIAISSPVATADPGQSHGPGHEHGLGRNAVKPEPRSMQSTVTDHPPAPGYGPYPDPDGVYTLCMNQCQRSRKHNADRQESPIATATMTPAVTERFVALTLTRAVHITLLYLSPCLANISVSMRSASFSSLLSGGASRPSQPLHIARPVTTAILQCLASADARTQAEQHHSPLSAMIIIRTSLLLIVGLASYGPIATAITPEEDARAIERAQIVDELVTTFPLPHHYPYEPPRDPGSPEPSDYDLCMNSCRGNSKKHTEASCSAWCTQCIRRGRGDRCY
ncbi:hypothetical protein V8E36_000031 [Tilletia maclaganii]